MCGRFLHNSWLRRVWVQILIMASMFVSSSWLPAANGAHVVPKSTYEGKTTYSYAYEKSVQGLNPRWTFMLGQPSDAFDGEGRAALSGDLALFVKNDKLNASSVVTGKLQWSVGKTIRAPLSVIGSSVYVTSWKNELFRYDVRSGKLLWTYAYKNNPALSDMVNDSASFTMQASGELLLFRYMGMLVALDAKTGKMRWTWSDAESYMQEIFVLNIAGATPMVLVPSEKNSPNDGVNFHALDLKTGKRLWSAGPTLGPLLGVVNNRLLFEDLTPRTVKDRFELKLAVLDRSNGKRIETRSFLPVARGKDPLTAQAKQIALNGIDLYVQSNEGTIYRFDVRNPGLKTPLPLSKRVNWIAGPHRDKLFFAKERFDGLLSVKTVNGSEWFYPALDNPVGKLLLHNNGLYVAQTDGELFAIDLTTGKPLFRYQAQSQYFPALQVSGSRLMVEAEDRFFTFELPPALLKNN